MAELEIPILPEVEPEGTNRSFGLALTEEPSPMARAICRRVAFLALLVYCLYSVGMVLRTSAPLLHNQWENTYPEAPQIYAAIRAAQTGRLYRPFTEQPYLIQPYGPLYYEINAWLARIVHANIDRFIVLSRSVAFACFLLCGVLIFAVCRRFRFSVVVSFAAAALPLGVPFFCSWNVAVRPDMYFLAAMLASLLLAIWEDSPSIWVCAAAGALGGIAFLIKQPGVAVLIALAAVWLMRGKFWRTVQLAAGAAVPVVFVFTLLLVHKEHFVDQYFLISHASRSFSDGWFFSISVLLKLTQLLLVGIGVLGFARALKAGERAQIIASFALVNWFIGLAGMSQLGAGPNYFLPGLLGCGLLLPFALDLIHHKIKSASVLAVIAFALFYLSYDYAIKGVLTGQNFTANPYQSFGQFRILSDRPMFALRGRDADLLDPLSIHNLELGAGNSMLTPIEERVQSGAYDLVILACTGGRLICNFRGINSFGLGVINAMNQTYSVFCTNENAIVLTPRFRGIKVTPDMLGPALGASCSTQYQGHTPDLVILAGTR